VSTPAADAMNQIVRSIAPMLKEVAFRKRRHSFHRWTDDGITQVVSFQMGPYRPPNAYQCGGGRHEVAQIGRLSQVERAP
jgi:hypothetical protein